MTRMSWLFVAIAAALFPAANSFAETPVAPAATSPLPASGAFSPRMPDGSWPESPIGAFDECCDERPVCFWASAEYLLWWMKPVCQKAALLNAGSPADPIPGANGQPGTQEIFTSAARYNMPGSSGVRVAIGGWSSAYPRLGWDASAFWLPKTENRSLNFTSGDGSPFTYLPYTDQNNVEQAIPFTVPGQVAGSITAVGSSQLWGADANLIWRFAETRQAATTSASLLFGFRHLNLHDQVVIDQSQTLLANPTQVARGEANFQTHNDFYAPQIGTRFTTQYKRLIFDATGKFAPGEVHLVSDVSGNPFISGPQVLAGSVPGPLIAFPTNTGRATAWRFAFAQEISLRARYVVSRHVQLSLGYNLIYLNRISCPGDNMPQMVNVTQVPALGPATGKTLPLPVLNWTDYFAHGPLTGLECTF